MPVDVPLILKALITPQAFAGFGMTLMGMGVIPFDEGLLGVAKPFIANPSFITIPPAVFFSFLGPAKIAGISSMWGIGPAALRPYALGGLITSALAASLGHALQGEVPQSFFALSSAAMIGYLAVLEQKQIDSATKKE